MKIFFINILLFALTSCSSFHGHTDPESKLRDKYKKLVGLSYYLIVKPVTPYLAKGKEYHGFKISNNSISRCNKVKIAEIFSYANSKNPHVTILKQGDEYFAATIKANYTYAFVDKIPFAKRAIKLKSGTTDSRKLLCAESFWTGMTENELYFVKSLPDKTNTSQGSYGTHKQLIYEKGEYKNDYFYIKNGILSSWQLTN